MSIPSVKRARIEPRSVMPQVFTNKNLVGCALEFLMEDRRDGQCQVLADSKDIVRASWTCRTWHAIVKEKRKSLTHFEIDLWLSPHLGDLDRLKQAVAKVLQMYPKLSRWDLGNLGIKKELTPQVRPNIIDAFSTYCPSLECLRPPAWFTNIDVRGWLTTLEKAKKIPKALFVNIDLTAHNKNDPFKRLQPMSTTEALGVVFESEPAFKCFPSLKEAFPQLLSLTVSSPRDKHLTVPLELVLEHLPPFVRCMQFMKVVLPEKCTCTKTFPLVQKLEFKKCPSAKKEIAPYWKQIFPNAKITSDN